jgi:hypothetical protein
MTKRIHSSHVSRTTPGLRPVERARGRLFSPCTLWSGGPLELETRPIRNIKRSLLPQSTTRLSSNTLGLITRGHRPWVPCRDPPGMYNLALGMAGSLILACARLEAGRRLGSS